jgi:hypothetical protein
MDWKAHKCVCILTCTWPTISCKCPMKLNVFKQQILTKYLQRNVLNNICKTIPYHIHVHFCTDRHRYIDHNKCIV